MSMKKRGDGTSTEQAGPIETELRLAGDAKTLTSVFGSPLMTSLGRDEDKLTDLKSSYYDTEDQQLRAKGLALRVRTEAGGHCQTLKSGDASHAALLSRSEWSVAVDSDRPDLDALPEEARNLLPKAAKRGQLRNAFTTRVRRRTREVSGEGNDLPSCRIEAALDLGEIETPRGALPVAELELELLEGDAAALYRLAQDLHALGPLRLETRSKSSRAYDRLCRTSAIPS
jgi:inorganic triphosphatase YgiF